MALDSRPVYLIHTTSAVRGPAGTLEAAVLHLKLVIIGNLFACFDVAIRKYHNFLVLTIVRIDCDNLGIGIGLARVIHEAGHAANLGGIHDSF